MKKASHFILFLLLFGTLQAQNKVNPFKKTTHHVTSTCLYDSITQYLGIPGDWPGKTMIYFDANGNQTHSLQQNWNSTTNKWVNYLADTSTYNTHNQITWYLQESWDTTSKTWVNLSQIFYTYNSKNNLIGDLYQDWYNSNWLNDGKDSFAYNLNNKLIYNLTSVWDTPTTVWTNGVQSIYTYTSFDSLANETSWTWTGTSWANSDSSYYIYNTNNYPTKFYQNSWTGSAWQNAGLVSYVYDINNNIIDLIDSSWAYSTWTLEDSTSYTYNSNHVYTSYSSWSWNSFNKKWTLETFGNATLCNNTCYATAYDQNYSVGAGVPLPGWQRGIGYNDSVIYYGCAIAGITPIANNISALQLYPNPNNGSFSLQTTDAREIKSIEINNVIGQKVWGIDKLHITDEPYSINADYLAPGLYFLKVISDKGTQTVKFIKQ